MMRKKIYINRKPVLGAWGGGNRFLLAMCEQLSSAGCDVVFQPQRCDVALALGVDAASSDELSAAQVVALATACGAVSVFRVNDCDARKMTMGVDIAVRRAALAATKLVFVSEWLKRYFGDLQRDSEVIVNGVDTAVFTPVKHVSPRNPVNVVTHHWSDNRMKGALWYEALDAAASRGELTFTYVGRHKCVFRATRVIEPCDGAELAHHIQSGDVYVSGSEHDPGPNHILEAIACGMPLVVSANGGGGAEFAGAKCAASSAEEMLQIIRDRAFKRSDFRVRSWADCTNSFMRVMKIL